MSEPTTKPVPRVTADSAEFWRFCAEGRLMLRSCADCGNIFFYPRILCPACMSSNLIWTQASGAGTVHAVTIVHRAPGEAFRADVPYTVALIDLAEGPRLMSNIVHYPPSDVHIGMAVRLVFEPRAEGIVIPQFTPVEGEAA